MNYVTELMALIQVILIDVSLSGDNAVVIGMAASGLEENKRVKAIIAGTIFAIVLRIGLSCGASMALGLPYISIVGGLLLLWVCWKMFGDIRAEGSEETAKTPTRKTLLHAITLIIVADASMSLDNVLAVAAAAKDHLVIMAIGLLLSIAMMAIAANFISKLLKKWAWLNYAGLAIILYLAIEMLVRGIDEQIR